MMLSCLAYSSTLQMEAACSSETSVHFHETTQSDIPEDKTLHSHRCENVKCKIKKNSLYNHELTYTGRIIIERAHKTNQIIRWLLENPLDALQTKLTMSLKFRVSSSFKYAPYFGEKGFQCLNVYTLQKRKECVYNNRLFLTFSVTWVSLVCVWVVDLRACLLRQCTKLSSFTKIILTHLMMAV
jgi:hypothetical protein